MMSLSNRILCCFNSTQRSARSTDEQTALLGGLTQAQNAAGAAGANAQVLSNFAHLRSLIGNYEAGLQSQNFQSVTLTLYEIFKAVLLVTNWSVAVEETDANPRYVAGLMAIQAFVHELIMFILHRLRGHQRPLVEYFMNAVMGTVVLGPVTLMFFRGQYVASATSDPDNVDVIAAIAALTALACLTTQNIALSIIMPFRAMIDRALGLSAVSHTTAAQATIAEPAASPPARDIVVVQREAELQTRVLPLAQRILAAGEGDFGSIFLIVLIGTFTFTNYPPFARVMQHEAERQLPPLGNWGSAMEVCCFALVVTYFLALMKCLWISLWGSITPPARLVQGSSDSEA